MSGDVQATATLIGDLTNESHDIGSIQAGTEHAVDSMRNSTERAESTLNIAKGAGMSLDTINTAIVEVNERNLVIASAAEEQAQVAREVDRNLVNIRDLSVQSASGGLSPGGGFEWDGRAVSSLTDCTRLKMWEGACPRFRCIRIRCAD